MKVGIIGAGTMGSGIAQAFAQTEGYEVYLCDINEEFAANGKNKIAKGLQRLVTKGKKTQEDVDAILAKITTGVKDICTDCDLIVEAALKLWMLKTDIQRIAGYRKERRLHFRYEYFFFVHYRNRCRHFSSGYRNALL